jgi:hypothetical protein
MNENRNMFDWIMFLLIHVTLIGGISYAGWNVYGEMIGVWVAASAIVAGITSSYLFAKGVPGVTLMKVVLGIAVALNAAYIVHNGARNVGISSYNDAQLRKFELAMGAAAQARTRAVANAIGVNARESTQLEQAFSDGVSTIAAILAFFELCLAVIFFAIASKRVEKVQQETTRQSKPPVGFSGAAPPYPAMASTEKEARTPKA